MNDQPEHTRPVRRTKAERALAAIRKCSIDDIDDLGQLLVRNPQLADLLVQAIDREHS